jgi:hypothetical protein
LGFHNFLEKGVLRVLVGIQLMATPKHISQTSQHLRSKEDHHEKLSSRNFTNFTKMSKKGVLGFETCEIEARIQECCGQVPRNLKHTKDKPSNQPTQQKKNLPKMTMKITRKEKFGGREG